MVSFSPASLHQIQYLIAKNEPPINAAAQPTINSEPIKPNQPINSPSYKA
jgi:hypothetical protein